jgi:hypothetical protein
MNLLDRWIVGDIWLSVVVMWEICWFGEWLVMVGSRYLWTDKAVVLMINDGWHFGDLMNLLYKWIFSDVWWFDESAV